MPVGWQQLLAGAQTGAGAQVLQPALTGVEQPQSWVTGATATGAEQPQELTAGAAQPQLATGAAV